VYYSRDEETGIYNKHKTILKLSERLAFHQVMHMLEKAFGRIPDDSNPILRSDQGWQRFRIFKYDPIELSERPPECVRLRQISQDSVPVGGRTVRFLFPATTRKAKFSPGNICWNDKETEIKRAAWTAYVINNRYLCN
jgi:hypothetical protein